MWEQTAQPRQRLHFVSIEKFPFDRDQLARALSAWPELKIYSQRLLEAWPGRVRGLHRLDFGPVSLTLIHEDVDSAFDQIDGLKANAWFLDGFSPAGNPAMWRENIMKNVANASAPGARLATFSVAGAVRTALKDAGFEVSKMPGFGRKRHRLEALYAGEKSEHTPSVDKVLIVGAGIAGRSLAKALSARHISFDMIDDRKHPAASGNPAALVKPRFDIQDRPESRFFLAAYLHALRTYPPEAILSRGVRQLPKTEKEATRFQKLINHGALGEGHLDWQDNALHINSALVIDPAKVFPDFDIKRESYQPSAHDPLYSHVIFAAGYGLRTIAPQLSLRSSRGQISWAKPIWEHPTAYGGYAINLGEDTLVGATHDRLDEENPFEIRAKDDERNLSQLAEVSGQPIAPSKRSSRASVRVTSHDTLPIIADLGNNHWALTGLGSRGFTFAPLLAEALVANMCAECGPLDKRVRALFSDPNRFL